MNELVEFKQKDTIAEIALYRPEAYNAFNYEMVTLIIPPHEIDFWGLRLFINR
jgi:enoyl-CoA hydratase/carnithine racemase